jgi:hypothetical protein
MALFRHRDTGNSRYSCYRSTACRICRALLRKNGGQIDVWQEISRVNRRNPRNVGSAADVKLLFESGGFRAKEESRHSIDLSPKPDEDFGDRPPAIVMISPVAWRSGRDGGPGARCDPWGLSACARSVICVSVLPHVIFLPFASRGSLLSGYPSE